MGRRVGGTRVSLDKKEERRVDRCYSWLEGGFSPWSGASQQGGEAASHSRGRDSSSSSRGSGRRWHTGGCHPSGGSHALEASGAGARTEAEAGAGRSLSHDFARQCQWHSSLVGIDQATRKSGKSVVSTIAPRRARRCPSAEAGAVRCASETIREPRMMAEFPAYRGNQRSRVAEP
jgi:hypothetical protein